MAVGILQQDVHRTIAVARHGDDGGVAGAKRDVEENRRTTGTAETVDNGPPIRPAWADGLAKANSSAAATTTPNR